MSRSSTHTFTLDVPPDRALEILASEDFEIAQQSSQGATKSCSVEEVSRTDDTFVYNLHAVEYGKGVTGIDKSKTENSITRVTWDLKRRKSAWTYEGAQKRVKIWGSTSIQPQGDGSRVTSEFNIDVKIPLVGGQVEKVVVKESAKHMKDNFEPIARRMAQEG